MNDLSPKDFEAGRYFTNEENSAGSHVAVIGADLAQGALSGWEGVGKDIHAWMERSIR